MYCQLFDKYINDHECNICDSRSGYEVDTWKYTCDHNRLLHHPILNKVRWWIKPIAFKQKLFICIAFFVNFLKPKRRWFVHWDNYGLHVGIIRLFDCMNGTIPDMNDETVRQTPNIYGNDRTDVVKSSQLGFEVPE